jgi:ATP phosphoribosyltransferase
MDVVVDLTETGTTLRRNGLKIVGQIMESYTVIVANRGAWADPEKRRAIDEIATLLLGVLDARSRTLLSMNVPAGSMDAVMDALPALKRPTVSALFGLDYYSVETVVQKSGVNRLIPQLKAAGAEDILEIPIAKIIR